MRACVYMCVMVQWSVLLTSNQNLRVSFLFLYPPGDNHPPNVYVSIPVCGVRKKEKSGIVTG